MDNEAEDWEKQKRIKAEKERAAKDAVRLEGDKTNLAYLDAKSFAVQKGKLSNNPDAYLNSGEKMAGVGFFLSLVGMLGEKVVFYFLKSIGNANQEHFSAENEAASRALGILYSGFYYLSFLALILAVFATISAIWYYHLTRKKVLHIFIAAGATVAVFCLNRWLAALVAM